MSAKKLSKQNKTRKGDAEAGNAEIGRRLRVARNQAGYTQTDAGKFAGVSFQQIQKYENGSNRIPVIRLIDFGRKYNQPHGYFVDGIKTVNTQPSGGETTDSLKKASTLFPKYKKLIAVYDRFSGAEGQKLALQTLEELAKNYSHMEPDEEKEAE